MNDANDAVRELRKADRYVALEPLEGTCEGYEVSLLNVGTAGAMIRSAQAIRIGTATTLTFRHGAIKGRVPVQVVWSQLVNGFLYRSGVRVLQEDPAWSAAVEALIRAGIIVPDDDSLERKRERDLAREERRKSDPRLTALTSPTE